jgi:hypothetical protein
MAHRLTGFMGMDLSIYTKRAYSFSEHPVTITAKNNGESCKENAKRAYKSKLGNGVKPRP